MNHDLQNPEFRHRWAHIAEPGWEINQQIFSRTDRSRTKVLRCAIPLTQAKRLTDAVFPAGWDADKCLVASVGRRTFNRGGKGGNAEKLKVESGKSRAEMGRTTKGF